MPRLYHAAVAATVAWLALTAPAYAKRRPSNAPPAEGIGLSLAGPCAAFAWHNPDEHRVTVLDLGPMGFTARPGALGLQRETAGVCPTASPWSLGVGATYGPQIADERADYFVAGGYQVQRGAWRIAALAGVIYEPLLTRPHRLYTTIHTGSWFPFFMVTVKVRF